MRRFVAASDGLSFAGASRAEIYGFVEGVLRRQRYLGLSKKDKGVVRRYLVKVSGLSLPQITRLIRRYRQRGKIQPTMSRRHRFARRYTAEDISRPRISTICGRPRPTAVIMFISPRRAAAWLRSASEGVRTRAADLATCVSTRCIRATPRKGLYHINAVDTLTQWQIVGCCETISEAHLLPVLEAILHQFPFRIRGFHSDNGSEFLNKRVRLAQQAAAEFTKSRAYRTTDNALLQGKTPAVVRKHIGHEPIGAHHAAELQRFYTAYFNPYLNHHRPCGFATIEQADNGRRRRHYRLDDYRITKSCFQSGRPIKEGISHAALQRHRMRPAKAAKRKLLAACRSRW